MNNQLPLIRLPDGPKTPRIWQRIQWVVDPVGYMEQATARGVGGKVVVGCIYLLHQWEDIYPEPKQFQPDRFLSRQYSPYEFMPFGAGARRCIGSALAMYEMKLVLATILLNYKIELVDRRPLKPQRRGVVLVPAGGVNMVMKDKRDRPKQNLKLL